jgi:hypothetical protein
MCRSAVGAVPRFSTACLRIPGRPLVACRSLVLRRGAKSAIMSDGMHLWRPFYPSRLSLGNPSDYGASTPRGVQRNYYKMTCFLPHLLPPVLFFSLKSWTFHRFFRPSSLLHKPKGRPAKLLQNDLLPSTPTPARFVLLPQVLDLSPLLSPFVTAPQTLTSPFLPSRPTPGIVNRNLVLF